MESTENGETSEPVSRHLQADRGTTERSDLVQVVKKLKSPLPQILRCDPFDHLSGRIPGLSSDLFFDHLYAKTDALQKTYQTLEKRVSSAELRTPFIILAGFAGTGKSTFLHFIKERLCKCPSYFVDFNDREAASSKPAAVTHYVRAERVQEAKETFGLTEALAGALQATAEHQQSSGAPVLNVLRRAFLEEGSQLHWAVEAALSALKGDLNSAEESFSESFIRLLNRTELPTSRRSLKWVLDVCDAEDLLTLFYLTNFSASAEKARLKKGSFTVAIFDNIDRIEAGWFGTDFLTLMGGAYENALKAADNLRIGEDVVDCRSCLTTIVCARDATRAAFDAHMTSAFHTLQNEIWFPFRGDQMHSQAMLRERLRLITEVFSGETAVAQAASKLGSVVQATVPSAEGSLRVKADHGELDPYAKEAAYFASAIGPLFNYNYKKLVPMIVGVLESELPGTEMPQEPAQQRLWAYGQGANWMFQTVDFLIRRDYLRQMFDPTRNRPAEEGYCMPSRAVLTFLLNRGQYRPKTGRSRAVSVMEVVDAFAGIYSPDEIVRTLEQMFIGHQKDFVHLVRIRGGTFSESKLVEIQGIRERGPRGWFSAAARDTAEGKAASVDLEDDDRRILQRIVCAVTPAGYSAVMHLLVHFETFSRLTSRSACLFERASHAGVAGGEHSELLDSIDRAIDKIEKFCKSMNAFFETNYEKKRQISPEQYSTSEYSFKRLGDEHSGSRGYFHSFRILTHAISYLDHFRRFCVSIEGADRPLANRALIAPIGRLIGLLRNCPDPAADNLAAGLTRKLKTIDYHSGEQPIAL